jgi:hypothetical protein
MWKNSFTYNLKRNNPMKEMMKYRTRYGVNINFPPVIQKYMMFIALTTNIVQKQDTNNLNRSIKVECLIIPAYVLKIYMKIVFTRIIETKTTLLSSW